MSDHTSGELIGGRYALGELLGVGGTGSVFAATEVGVDGAAGAEGVDGRARATGVTEVAVKLLHPHLCADEASREAFLREAEHAIGLQHPNVVRVRGAGLHDAAGVTMPWIALDLLHGPTLREWVDSTGRLSTTDAAALADGLLSGLAAAHEAGIVHRDISPQNVILHGAHDRRAGAPLTADMVRIVDFGLADVTGRSTLGGDVLLADDGGAGAGVVGNAAYMSPEQAQGLPMRSASDLYQAGAVLYFALTGRPPFPRGSTDQVLQAHVSAPPPVPSALAPGTRAFDRIVTRAMAKKPVQRYWDAEAFRAAVREAVPHPSVAATAAAQAAVTGAETAPDGVDEPNHLSTDGAEPATRVLRSSQTQAEYLRPVAPLGGAEGSPVTNPAPPRAGGGAAVAAGLVILALAGWAVMAASAAPGEPTAAPTSTAPSPPPATPAPTPSGSSAPPAATVAPSTLPIEAPSIDVPVEIAVPALHGSLADADAALRAAGLALGVVARIESADPADRLLSQSPPAGQKLPPGSVVDVTVASGNNVVPQTSRMTVAAATATLQSAGFAVATDRADPSPSATVTGSQPGAGTVLRVGVTVLLVVDTSTPTPAPTGTPPTQPGAAS